MSHSTNVTIAVVDRASESLADGLRSRSEESCLFLPGTQMPAQLGEVDVLITQNIFPEPGTTPKLQWIQLLSAGTDHVPEHIRACRQWSLTHCGGAAAVPMAEWCLAMMLHFAHRVEKIQKFQAARSWYKSRIHEMGATALRGQAVGIVGYGAFGREVGRLCQAFGMTVLASRGRYGTRQSGVYRTVRTGDPTGEVPSEWFSLHDLPQVLPRLDFVVLGLRLTPETHHLIDEKMLRLFKPSAILMNPSRGPLIDEIALVEALQQGRLAGAALDVFETEPLPPDHPLRDAPNLVISPHCSPESGFYRNEMIELICENLRRFVAAAPLLNEVRQ